MSDNTGILQVPVTGKSTENDPQKLVYVHVPKNKDTTLPTTFTLTKSTKLSGGSITFSSHSAPSSPTNKVRPPILGNKITISPTIAKTAANISINPSKSIKVSLSNSRSIGGTSAPTVFRAANTGTSNLPSNFISQGAPIPIKSRSSSGISKIRSPSIVSQVSTFKSQKPVLLQSKILSSLKGSSQKVVTQKMMSVPLTAKQTGRSSTLVSYGKILPNVVSNNNGSSIKYNNSNQPDTALLVSSGIKRDHFGSPKREGGCLNSFTPPPLILQSGSNAKKLGNKKGGPATISIVTGKASSGSSGFNFYPMTRSNNTSSNCTIAATSNSSLKNNGKSNSFRIAQSASSGNYKIINGLVDSSSGCRESCDLKVLSTPIDEDLKSKLPDSTTFFKKVCSSINNQVEEKDILQQAMTAMVSDLHEVITESAVSQYRNESDSSLVNAGLQNKSSRSLSEPIPIIFSKNASPECPTPILLQGTLPLPSSGAIPVTVHNMLPIKVHSSSNSTSSHFSSQGHMEKQNIPGLIIRTDTVTVRRKIPGTSSKEEDRKESTKPDLSIIPILQNNSNTTQNNTSVVAKPIEQTSVRDNYVDSAENKGLQHEHESFHKGAINTKKSGEKDDTPVVGDNSIAEDKAEVKDLLNWENGTGSLVGSDLKFKINEFNAVELVEDEALEGIRNQIGSLGQDGYRLQSSDCNINPSNISSNNNNTYSETEMISEQQLMQDKTSNLPTLTLPPTPTKTSNNPVHVHHARKPNLNNCRKDEESSESDAKNSESRSNKDGKNPNDICCCKNCGCYGLSSEFVRSNDHNFCTVACSEEYSTKEAEWMKEKQKLEKIKQNRLKKTKSSDKESLEKLDSRVKDDMKDTKDEIKENEVDQNEEIKIKFNIKDYKDTMREDAIEDKQLEEKDSTSTDETFDVCSSQSSKDELSNSQESNKFSPIWQDLKTRSFSWVKYLEHCGRGKGLPRGAPLKLWSEPFPFGKNLFKTGMKLEGIDPQHQSLFCVMTVVDIVGHRIRLHFDGYSDMYDFWCNANSPNIFQAGWCEKNGRKLETPPGIYNFTWKAYLEHCKDIAAPKNAFATSTVAGTSSNFRIGMKLEAEDRKNGWMCVATVSDVLDNRILVHFDGWDKAFDIWFEISSPFIHPVGWCSKTGVYLYPPKDYSNIESFNWHEYLQETNSTSVPARAFKNRLPKEFKADMKLEAVDKRNPMLVRVATVIEVKPYKLLLHFDGWPDVYDFWVDDDSSDIHPPTWCSKSGHPLQSPLTPEQCAEDVDSGVGCGTQGCKGYGHVKGLIYNTHHTAYGCPYSLQNLHKDLEALLPDRLEPPKEKKKGKNSTKNFINLDASRPVPEESDESQKKRVRKRRKFFDELSPPEGISKPKISKTPSSALDDLNNKIQGINSKGLSSNVLGSQTNSNSNSTSGNQTPQTCSQSSSSSAVSDNTGTCSKNLNTSSSNSDSQSVETLVHQSIFNPGYHPNPPPPVPHTVDTHKHIVTSANATLRSDVERWRPDDVCNAISKIPGCEISSLKFMEQEIDGEALLLLTQNDLVSMLGIKLGPAIKIMSFVFNLRSMP